MNEPAEVEGIWDDIQTAREWFPILAMLRDIKAEPDLVKRLERVRDAVAFGIRTGTGADPYKRRAFLIFAKVVDTVKVDPGWRSIVADLLK